ncbi:hypothetical protein K461DRAFT_273920 [Myriangium duriaei CBS 260.36]|uniref:Uncharacterized protein n=1 Tax=Myriangium duriaei CBS 260.36 TaxID=1168546 RepID=A0A9P4JA55_9PEZI|nr:hypothetical protein K461DRAFT_273920 [Myriangium duriaei CBS 260.36]
MSCFPTFSTRLPLRSLILAARADLIAFLGMVTRPLSFAALNSLVPQLRPNRVSNLAALLHRVSRRHPNFP